MENYVFPLTRHIACFSPQADMLDQVSSTREMTAVLRYEQVSVSPSDTCSKDSLSSLCLPEFTVPFVTAHPHWSPWLPQLAACKVFQQL